MVQAWLCELHAPHLVVTLLQWLGFGSTARQQLQNSDLLELMQLSEEQVNALHNVDEFSKAELKRWQKATAALADVSESNSDQTLVCCSVQYALYMHLGDRALELAGTDIKRDDIEVILVEQNGFATIKAKLRMTSALAGKLQDSVQRSYGEAINIVSE